MRSRATRHRTSPLLLTLCFACGGTASPPPQTADDAETDVVAEAEEAPEEEPVEPLVEEPELAEDARQVLRASETPENTLGLDFVVSQRGADLPWLVALANSSQAPADVAADLRLLRLEVEPPQESSEKGSKATPPKAHVCELPKADRPSQPDRELQVELEPGLMLAQSFDPRLICEPEWLVPGAVVTPKFGWAPPTRTVWRQGKRVEEPLPPTEPYVATSAAAEGDPLEPIKELVGEPFTLDASYAPPPPPPEPGGDEPPPLELVVRDLGTITDPRSATITVEIKNPGRQGRHLFFRRELVTYEVIGPQGSTTCSVYPDDRAPQRQSFDFIGAKGSMRVVSRLIEMCSPHAFGSSGLYRVHARLDATESGKEQGLDAFVGTVTSQKPALLRLRGGKPAPMWVLPIRPPGNDSTR